MAASGRFDREALRERIDDDMELLGELFEDYVEDKAEHLEKVRNAVASNDMKLMYEGAHALRGCVANFCAHGAFELATQLQEQATSGQAPGAIETAKQLEHEIDLLTEELREFVGASKASD